MKTLYNSNHGTIYNGDCLEVMKSLPDNSIETCITDPPAGIGFMNKDWDHSKGGRDRWIEYYSERFREVNRILKPGGLAIVWAIPRTAHWTACALDDSGFEIQTKLYHLFGGGWPKGLDISKGIDNYFGCVREKGERRTGPNGKPYSPKTMINTHPGYHRPWMNLPIEEQNCLYESDPVHPLAQKWNDYKTQLKPMAEEWIVAMKPVEKNYVENAIKWGVAGYNIDGCRIETDEHITKKQTKVDNMIYGHGKPRETLSHHQKGRYPGNVVIDSAVADELDEAYGERKTGEIKAGIENKSYWSDIKWYKTNYFKASTGGASRFFTRCDYGPEDIDFFYSGKTSQGEKNIGLNDRCSHPTVKNLALMRWLCRLSKTPDGGTIIDPFAGTFSTLIAAYLEGRKFIGIEQNEEYCKIGVARLRHAMGMFFK